ncbi:MAG TPA: isocitrate/isopropylmalate family dehydrogenase [Thermomicrobiales bacterium]|nr:isocitrate/isopropylmalate family dehydrogenase [Thermomicrobiales bacterium]
METARRNRVTVIAGDGIGTEVMPVAIECLDSALASVEASPISWVERDWGSDHFDRHGRMMPADGLELMLEDRAIFLGAVGRPDIPDTETLWGLLIPIRREFGQYVNLRPVRTYPGVPSPVGSTEIDMVIVRENNEGEYSEIGGRLYRGDEMESAQQTTVFTRRGITRVAAFAAELARSRGRLLTSATKSNGIIHTMPFWDEVVEETVAGYPDVRLEKILIDALAAKLVAKPESFDVIVASNLFGDILSDLAGALAGSIGIAPSGNIDPTREHPSMFEPVHGSAPDIAGKGIANPVGQILSGVMLLEHLGEQRAADLLTAAVETTLADGVRTADLGGSASTIQFGAAVLARITSPKGATSHVE